MQFELFEKCMGGNKINEKLKKKALLNKITLTVTSGQAYPIDSINESIIWKMNLSVVGATSIKF